MKFHRQHIQEHMMIVNMGFGKGHTKSPNLEQLQFPKLDTPCLSLLKELRDEHDCDVTGDVTEG